MISWLRSRFLKLELLSDKVLIAKVKKGDREAFGKLYMKYLDAIYRYVFFRVNQDKETAEDLTEAVFFKAWENLKEYPKEDLNFRAWLYRVAHNAVIDHYRKEKRFVPMSQEEGVSESLEEKIAEKDEKERLLKEIKNLTDEQRQVITLKFIEGLGNGEIGRILNKKEDAVRAIQYRALTKLRNLLT